MAVFGAGPVGQFAIRSAFLLGAERVIAVDDVPERLAMAADAGAEPLDESEGEVIQNLRRKDGRAGARLLHRRRRHGGARPWGDRLVRQGQAGRSARDGSSDRAPHGDRSVPAGRNRFDPGRLRGSARQGPLRRCLRQGLDVPDGPNARPPLRPAPARTDLAGEIDPSFVITHRIALEDVPEAYETFRDKKDGCIKVVIDPVPSPPGPSRSPGPTGCRAGRTVGAVGIPWWGLPRGSRELLSDLKMAIEVGSVSRRTFDGVRLDFASCSNIATVSLWSWSIWALRSLQGERGAESRRVPGRHRSSRQLDPAHEQAIDKLKALSGAQFDAAYTIRSANLRTRSSDVFGAPACWLRSPSCRPRPPSSRSPRRQATSVVQGPRSRSSRKRSGTGWGPVDGVS